MKTIRTRARRPLTVLGTTLLATGLHAQETPATAIQEVVVTATRQSTLLSKTPVSMSAVTPDQLRTANITDATTLSDNVPNLSIARTNGLQVTIRGVSSSDGTEKGDPSAAFMLDGVYLARQQTYELSFFDLARIEVLRGPQGTLYGRNATAGVINVISAKPSFDRLSGSVEASYGSFDTVQSTGVLNVPVSPAFALRVALNSNRRNNYIRLAQPSAYTIDPAKDDISARVSGLIKFGETSSLLLRADASRQKGVPQQSVPLANFFPGTIAEDTTPRYVGRDADAQRTTTYPEAAQGRLNSHVDGFSAEWNTLLGNNELTYLGSARSFKRDEIGTQFAGANPYSFVADYEQQSHELRVAFGKGSRLHGQAGAYYFKEHSRIDFFLRNPQNLGLPPGVVDFGFPQNPTIAKSRAGFGQAIYDVAPAMHLTVGARRSIDEKSRVGATVFDTPAGRVKLSDNDASRTFSKNTWHLGLDYDVPALGLLYATLSTGYKAGGFNDGCEIGKGTGCTVPAQALYYSPETLTSLETGVKLKFAGGAVLVNGALFHYDYRNMQLSQLSNICGVPCTVTTNAGKARTDGVELETTIRLNPNNRLSAGVNYLDARYVSFDPVAGVSWAGKSLDRSPRWTGRLSYTYRHPLDNGGDLSLNAVARVSAAYVISDLGPRVQFRQPGFGKEDVSLTYTAPDDAYFVQLYGKNLSNRIAFTAATTATGATASIDDPRLFGVRAGVNF